VPVSSYVTAKVELLIPEIERCPSSKTSAEPDMIIGEKALGFQINEVKSIIFTNG
jgi:hypothetical protein